MIRLAFNENAYGVSPLVKKVVRENIGLISQYPPLDNSDLKARLAELTGFKTENIGLSAGSVTFIDILIKNFVKADENVIIPEISFIAYKVLAERYKLHFKLAKMNNYAVDIDAIEKLLDEKTRLVFLANPNNPTGTIFSHDQLYSFIKELNPKTYVVVDEAYLEYVDSKNYPRSLEFIRQFPNVIVLRSFSKAYGLAGLRIGYAISTKENISLLEGYNVPYSVTRVAALAAMTALDDNDFLAYCVEQNSVQRNLLFKRLREMGYNVVPSEGNFLFVHFDTTAQRDEFFDNLLKGGVLTKKMDAFGDKNALRITIGNKEENEQLISSLDDARHSL
jgi:histidinol-phosphate aminotransferase